ncbi:MAG: ZIP family metal transporter [Burkholderiales bacterium]
MSVFSWIVLASIVGGGASAVFAGGVASRLRLSSISTLVSFAVGAMLGAVFLVILPHAFEHGGNAETLMGTVLLGILAFFALEKLVLWRHCHEQGCDVHATGDQGRSGTMIIIGDIFHNFVDGVIIAAAFLADVRLGIVTSLAIIAHEIPQELGDFLVLLNSGYSRTRAFMFNLLAGLATLAGGVAGYFALQALTGWIPILLGIAAASLLYVSVADLIPGLHKRAELRATFTQVTLIAMGIATIWSANLLALHA